MNRPRFALLVILVAALWTAAPPASAGTLGFQGSLADPATGAGKPDGAYTVTFRLYETPTAGLALWSETKALTVAGGVFATELGDTTPLLESLFDGRDLWLGVTVESEAEMTPRTHLASVPSALHADDAGRLGGLDPSAYAPASHAHDAAYVNDDADEVDNLDVPDGALSPAKIAGTAWTGANMGAGSGLDADTLDGNDSAAFAPASHGHDGADIVTGTVADARIDMALTRDDEVMRIVMGADGPGSGLNADMLDGYSSADFSSSRHQHDATYLNTAGPDAMTGNSAGPVLTITQSGDGDALLAQGSVAADRVRYNAVRTHYLSLPGEAFHPGSNIDYINTYGNGGAFILSGNGALVAPVYLPDGAAVSAFTVYFDDTSSSNIFASLQFQHLGGTLGYATMAEVTSSGNGGIMNATDASIANPVIDNSQRYYLVYAYSTSWSSSLKLKGVRITYTVSEAP